MPDASSGARSRSPEDRLREILGLTNEIQAASVRRREADIEAARAFARLLELEAWKELGCASPGEFGERMAIAAADARALLDFGRAMKAAPYVESQVRNGRITVAAAALAGQALASPELLRAEDDWLGWAQTESAKSLRQRLARRREEVRMPGEAPVLLTVLVRPDARDDFARARAIASRKAARALTPGEAFETVVDLYLDTFDPDRVSPGVRRLPHTELVEGRYVPADVRREVLARQHGRCAVPFCDHTIFVEFAHLVPHASGGHREADNLVLLCSVHHRYFDEGALFLRGTAARPRFFDREGNDLARRFDRPDAIGPPPASAGPPEVTSGTFEFDGQSKRGSDDDVERKSGPDPGGEGPPASDDSDVASP